MALVTIDAGSRLVAGAVIFEAWKYGVEVESLQDYQVELCCADELKLDLILNKYPSVKVLHRELIKEVTW
jgi:hypothetical protein